VNGFVYSITYTNAQGDSYIFKVYISFQGVIQVTDKQSSAGTGVVGGPETLTKAQYSADPSFIQIDDKLRK
jgi:hypothetical protein